MKQPAPPPGDNFVVRIRTGAGEEYAVELGPGYDERSVRMEPFGQGIRVVHPGKETVYINAATRQASYNPEVCRSGLILHAESLDVARRGQDRSRVFDAALGEFKH